jgi:hypothetical protein
MRGGGWISNNDLMSKLKHLGFVLLMCCGGSDAGGDDGETLIGTWVGSAGGYDVTAKIDVQVANGSVIAVQGVVSTNRPTCFTNAILAGSRSLTSVELIGSGSGSVSTQTVVRLRGEVSGDEITGFLEVTSLTDDCHVDSTPIVLHR